MKYKKILYLILFLYFFIIFDINFHGPDEPIYFAYTASVVEDGDLNAINQFNKPGEFISKTYNLPDPRNHGGVILWVPFYLYAKGIYSLATKFNLTSLTMGGVDRLTKCALSFSTVVFGFLIIIFSYKSLKVFFSNKISFWSIFAIFLGTPFFYFMLSETGNANIIAGLFSVFLICFCSCMANMKKLHWFLYGMFFSVCVIVKVDLWLQLVYMTLFFISLCVSKRIAWRNGVYFVFGFIFLSVFRCINGYLKYGIFHMEEFRFISAYPFDGLFNSFRGIFYISPILYVCLLGSIFVVKNAVKNNKIKKVETKEQNVFFLSLTAYLFVKLFFIRNVFMHEDLSMRLLIVDFPILVLLFAIVLQNSKIYFRYLIGILSGFFVFWNLLIISEYMVEVDWIYIIEMPEIILRVYTLKYILLLLFNMNDLIFKLKLFLPFGIIVFSVGFYAKLKFREIRNYKSLYIKNE